MPAQYRVVLDAASADTGLPLSLLAAVAHVESDFSRRAVSSAGAVGMLQVLPRTARSLGFDVRDADEAVLAGARYLRLMLARFRSLPLALAAYNAGPAAVERAGGAPSASVSRYVDDVLEHRRRIGGCG